MVLTCWFTPGARARPADLRVHDPGVSVGWHCVVDISIRIERWQVPGTLISKCGPAGPAHHTPLAARDGSMPIRTTGSTPRRASRQLVASLDQLARIPRRATGGRPQGAGQRRVHADRGGSRQLRQREGQLNSGPRRRRIRRRLGSRRQRPAFRHVLCLINKPPPLDLGWIVHPPGLPDELRLLSSADAAFPPARSHSRA